MGADGSGERIRIVALMGQVRQSDGNTQRVEAERDALYQRLEVKETTIERLEGALKIATANDGRDSRRAVHIAGRLMEERETSCFRTGLRTRQPHRRTVRQREHGKNGGCLCGGQHSLRLASIAPMGTGGGKRRAG